MSSTPREQGFSLIDLLATMAVVGIVAAMAVPMTESSLSAYRFRGAGQAISNLVGLTKMRAAARFSRARVYVDLLANTYSMQIWDKAAEAWVADGGVMQMPRGVQFGFGTLDSPPPNTQAAIGFSPACPDDDGAPIANTACITFNSRGIPIDGAGAPTGGNAFYLTNGSAVYAVTVTATPMVRFWWSPAHAAAWVEQQ